MSPKKYNFHKKRVNPSIKFKGAKKVGVLSKYFRQIHEGDGNNHDFKVEDENSSKDGMGMGMGRGTSKIPEYKKMVKIYNGEILGNGKKPWLQG